MLTDTQLQQLKNISRSICDKYDLKRVYFAQTFGKRKHYLAGYGSQDFCAANMIDINEKTVFFWQGTLSEYQIAEIQKWIAPVMRDVEKHNRSTEILGKS